MANTSHPSNLELQALSVLWHEGPSTVGAVLDALPDGKDRAYTTVLSVMQSLERKKLVKRKRSGRAHIYEAAHSKDKVVNRATSEFLQNAFGGRLGEAILTLLSTGNLTPDEKTNIERELKRHKAMAAKKKAKKKAVKRATKRKVVRKAKKVVRKKKAAKKKVARKKKAAKKKVVRKVKKVARKKKAAKKKVARKKKAAKKKVARKVKKVARKKKAAKKKVARKKKAAKKKVVRKAKKAVRRKKK